MPFHSIILRIEQYLCPLHWKDNKVLVYSYLRSYDELSAFFKVEQCITDFLQRCIRSSEHTCLQINSFDIFIFFCLFDGRKNIVQPVCIGVVAEQL